MRNYPDEKDVKDVARLVAVAADAGITITNVRFNTCRCGGHFKPNGTPRQQNRWKCNKCGKYTYR